MAKSLPEEEKSIVDKINNNLQGNSISNTTLQETA
jgi:hypothetical protein